MGNYAECPGGCSGLVVIWPGNRVSLCCLNCWRWYWENGVLDEVPLDQYGEVIEAHSDQCYARQAKRRESGAVATAGNYELMSPPPRKVIDGQQAKL